VFLPEVTLKAIPKVIPKVPLVLPEFSSEVMSSVQGFQGLAQVLHKIQASPGLSLVSGQSVSGLFSTTKRRRKWSCF
jgi:hypothetical protein